jgi:hypothetical protein
MRISGITTMRVDNRESEDGIPIKSPPVDKLVTSFLSNPANALRIQRSLREKEDEFEVRNSYYLLFAVAAVDDLPDSVSVYSLFDDHDF